MRVEKLKSFGGIGKHIDRGYKGNVHIPENVDSSRVQSNVHWNNKGEFFNQKDWLEHTKNNPLSKRVNKRISEGYKLDKAIRKDAVKGLEYLFTSEQNKMDSIVSDHNLFKDWVKTNKQFLEDVHGKDNIVSLSCHFDEQTPHMHAVVVPLTVDGRLSARDFINGGKMLSELQTKYAEMMNKLGMKRGEVGSKRRHEKSNRDHLNKNYQR